ncbi:hypothetical protein AB4254_10880 [Vibrio breoganii]
MATLESEHGTFTLTKSGTATLAKILRETYNSYLDSLHQIAELYYASDLQAKSIDELNVTLERVINKNEAKLWHNPLVCGSHGASSLVNKENMEEVFEYVLAEVHRNSKEYRNIGNKLKPRKSKLPKLKNTQKNWDIEVFRGQLSLSDQAVSWVVRRDYKAVDQTRNSALYKLIFAALKNYKWKRGEGGVVWEWNEYDEGERSRPSHIRFGQKGEKELMNYRNT